MSPSTSLWGSCYQKWQNVVTTPCGMRDPARGWHLDLGGHPRRDCPERREPPTTRAPGGPARVDVSSLRGMLQETSYGSAMPNGRAGGSGTPLSHAPLRQAIQTAARSEVAGKDFLDPAALSRLDPNAGGSARTLQA